MEYVVLAIFVLFAALVGVAIVEAIRWFKGVFKKQSWDTASGPAVSRKASARRSAPQVAPTPSAKARQQRKPVQRPVSQAAPAPSTKPVRRKKPAWRKVPQVAPTPSAKAPPRREPIQRPAPQEVPAASDSAAPAREPIRRLMSQEAPAPSSPAVRRKASTRRPVPQAVPAPNSHAAPRNAPARSPDLPKPEQHWAQISWRRTVITGKAYVIDGDTIRVARRTIRLSGLDAPELDQVAKHEDGYWYKQGLRVKSELIRVIGGKPVRVIVEGTDKYQRILGTVLCEGRDVGEWLVRNGHAIAAYGEHYKHVERQARRERRGMWAHAEVHDPRAWRHR